VDPAGCLPRLQKPTSSVHPDPDETSPHHFVLFLLRYKQAYILRRQDTYIIVEITDLVKKKRGTLKFLILKKKILLMLQILSFNWNRIYLSAWKVMFLTCILYASCTYVGRQPTILYGNFHYFPNSLQAILAIVPQITPGWLLPFPFQFIIL